MLSTQLSLKSSGCILSLALLGSITLGGTTSAVNAAQAEAAVNAAQTESAPKLQQSSITLSGPWLCRVWTGDPSALSSTIEKANSLAAEAASSPVPLASHGNQPSQLQTGSATSDSEVAVSIATSFGASYADTTIHCTRKWHVSAAGYLISDAPNWVPDANGEWPASVVDSNAILHQHILAHILAVAARPKPKPKPHVTTVATPRPADQPLSYNQAPNPPSSPAPATGGGSYNPWAPVPGHPTYGMSDFSGDPYSSYFGYCTWYAWYRNQSEPLMRLGNAQDWAWNASAFGLHTGTVPVVGATAVFQPGVEGAGGGGHAGHVEAVLGGGWFIVSEMNFSWNGGGWGRVDWRYAYVTSGVTFIY